MSDQAPPESEWAFTALPTKAGLECLHGMFRGAWLDKVSGLLREFETRFSVQLPDIAAKIDFLRGEQKLSPCVYFLASRLRCAIEAGDLDGTFDVLQEFRMAACSSLVHSKLVIASILTESWEHQFVRVMRAYRPLRPNGEPIYPYETIVRPILSHPVALHAIFIREALAQIRVASVGLAAEFEELVATVRVFDGVVLRGMTSPTAYGAVFIRIPGKGEEPTTYWIEHLVHEVSHLKLELLLQQDRLVLNPADHRFEAPIRKDLRPMHGVLHATFVLSRMVRVFRFLVKAGYRGDYEKRLGALERRFSNGMATLRGKAVFTEPGKSLLLSLDDCAYG